jgi:hypothetical protein
MTAGPEHLHEDQEALVHWSNYPTYSISLPVVYFFL